MKKIKLPLLLSALVLSGLSYSYAAPAAGAKPAYDLLADLGAVPGYEVVLSTPTFVTVDSQKGFVKPPCEPSQALQPGSGFRPMVSDARRVKAIDELLAKIAVCKTLPYDNDGIIHSQPHNGLPVKPSGYYLEYTLIVPDRPTGSKPEAVVIGGATYMTGPVLSFRGPERLMIGNHREVYYTPDHYKTFVNLAIVR